MPTYSLPFIVADVSQFAIKAPLHRDMYPGAREKIKPEDYTEAHSKVVLHSLSAPVYDCEPVIEPGQIICQTVQVVLFGDRAAMEHFRVGDSLTLTLERP